MTSKKKRIDVRLDPVKHADVIEYLETYVDNYNAFIKNLLVEYVRSKKQEVKVEIPSENQRESTKKSKDKTQIDKSVQKENSLIRKLGSNVFSSKDIDLED